MKSCGTCVHGKFVKEDITKRICRGAPPQIIALPMGGGKARLEMHWPLVETNDEGCGMHKPRFDVDMLPGNAVKQ